MVPKVKGRAFYFGKVTPDGDHGAQAALEKWLAEKDDLLAGRTPRAVQGAVTIRELLNRFLTHKQRQVETGELAGPTFQRYKEACARVGHVVGLNTPLTSVRPEDFTRLRIEMGRTLKLLAASVEIQRTKTIFHYARKVKLIDRPVEFSEDFAISAKALRKEKAKRPSGTKLFTPGEVHALLAAANRSMRAMILLALNCGMGNHDLGSLTRANLNLESGWHNHPRPKNGIERRCPLWPETVEALKAMAASRPEPADPAFADLVFLTRFGRPFCRMDAGNWRDAIVGAFEKLSRKCGLKRETRGFYSFRHTFRTIADAARDQVAANYIMGHVDTSMAATYRETIDDERLRAVVDHVRAWLFGQPAAPVIPAAIPGPAVESKAAIEAPRVTLRLSGGKAVEAREMVQGSDGAWHVKSGDEE